MSAVDLKITDRIEITVVTVGCSAFEGGGQDQIATIWADEREVLRLSRHRSPRYRGYGNWHGWFELKWTGRSEQPLVPVQGGLMEVVSIVADLLTT